MTVPLWNMRRAEALAELARLPDACIDAVITDPPYSSGGLTRGDRMNDAASKYERSDVAVHRSNFDGDNRDGRGFAYWCALWMAECLRVAKPGAPICVFTDWRQLPATTDSMQAGGWVWRGIVPWDKTEAVRPQMGRFRAQAEYVVWGSAGPMSDGLEVGVLPGVLREKVQQADKHHLTGKPTALMQAIVRICPPGGLILDPFAGSGTTGVAALLEGRRFLGVEMNPGYFDVAAERCAAASLHYDAAVKRKGQRGLFEPAPDPIVTIEPKEPTT